ncbi:Pentatricopeptide repeat-containing protein [Dendrobium catenatum]|uniref:Pentatricopeptide repeat-containing protein n=1 Tax=Dendrobium catenatum TaxID=906689 RepID=A0A2I0XJN6_9ASPA|nr:Pentatricopeptide repeat-containing protein [Dendrobium catenatum]
MEAFLLDPSTRFRHPITALPKSPTLRAVYTNPSPSFRVGVRCGLRDGPRKPLWRGRVLSKEAIQAVQALKLAKSSPSASANARTDGDDKMTEVFRGKIARLLKADLLDVLKELQRQNEWGIALQRELHFVLAIEYLRWRQRALTILLLGFVVEKLKSLFHLLFFYYFMGRLASFSYLRLGLLISFFFLQVFTLSISFFSTIGTASLGVVYVSFEALALACKNLGLFPNICLHHNRVEDRSFEIFPKPRELGELDDSRIQAFVGSMFRLGAKGELSILLFEVFTFIKKEVWYKPDLSLYSDMIMMMGKNKLIENAENLFVEIEKEGVHPDTRAFTEIIGAFLQVGNVDKAMHMYNLMKNSGCNPDKLTFTILVRNLEKAGEEDLAISVRRDCKQYIDSPEKFLQELDKEYLPTLLASSRCTSDQNVAFNTSELPVIASDQKCQTSDPKGSTERRKEESFLYTERALALLMSKCCNFRPDWREMPKERSRDERVVERAGPSSDERENWSGASDIERERSGEQESNESDSSNDMYNKSLANPKAFNYLLCIFPNAAMVKATSYPK